MDSDNCTLAGKCLVASPHLVDCNFFRSVVFILKHDSEGSIGFIVNRPSSQRAGDCIQDICDVQFSFNGLIYCGGPVDGPIFALHDQRDLDDFGVINDVFCTTDQDALIDLFNRPTAQVKLFDGYSGWGAGQLEAELRLGGWLVSEITSPELFQEPDDLWQQVVHRVGNQIISQDELLPKKLISGDSSLN